MLFNIVAGPLILTIGYRSVAIISGFLLTLGIVGAAMLIGTEYPFTMLMFWYGFVTRRYMYRKQDIRRIVQYIMTTKIQLKYNVSVI